MGKKRREKARHEEPKEEAAPPASFAPVDPAETSAGPPESATRRELLLTAGRLTVGASGLLVVGGAVRMAIPDFDPDPPRRLCLGALARFERGTLTWLREAALFVHHDPGGLGVCASRCTHLGCELRRVEEGFVCPCHGGRFDAAGQPRSGPPRKALPWYRAWRDAAGRLWVDRGEEVPAGTRPLESDEERQPT